MTHAERKTDMMSSPKYLIRNNHSVVIARAPEMRCTADVRLTCYRRLSCLDTLCIHISIIVSCDFAIARRCELTGSIYDILYRTRICSALYSVHNNRADSELSVIAHAPGLTLDKCSKKSHFISICNDSRSGRRCLCPACRIVLLRIL